MDKEAVGMEREALALGLKAMQHAMPYFQRGFETGLLERAIAAAQAALAQQPAAQAAGLMDGDCGTLHIAIDLADSMGNAALADGLRSLLSRAAPSGEPQAEEAQKVAHALAGEISAAVAKDEAGEGCDIAAGLFGPKFSALIRRIATEYLAAKTAEEARGVDGGLMEAIRRYAFLFALHTQNNTDASRTEADAALARVRALLAAPAAGTGQDIEAIAKAAWDEAWELAFSDGECAGHPLGRSRLNCEDEWGRSDARATLADMRSDIQNLEASRDGYREDARALHAALLRMVAMYESEFDHENPHQWRPDWLRDALARQNALEGAASQAAKGERNADA